LNNNPEQNKRIYFQFGYYGKMYKMYFV